MALLHSLEICGVRSFSPENKEAISFNTPVTLFLGQNGCGKTTIIESIRYALTSELPTGSNSGQGFLNDPKMSHKNQVKASVKIKFFDSQGNMVTVARFMSVSIKTGGGLTFKNLMPIIRKRDKDNDGEPEDISGRCIDIDSYCCSALNVSKSILNNVLFCHQENSAWPLEEPKKLKEKFDEIFDAVKYNKCVEMTRKFIKDRQANMKVLNERLEHKRTIKDEVERQRGKLTTKTEELSSILDQIKEKQTQLGPLEKRREEILDLEDSLGSLQRELHEKQAERKGLIEQQADIKKHISYIFKGTDGELKTKISTFHSQQTIEKNTINDLEKKKHEVIEKISEINMSIQGTQVKIGQLKEEQKQYLKKVEESGELIESIGSELEIKDFSNIHDKKSVINEIKHSLIMTEEKYNSLVKQKDMEESELQSKIDQIREKYAGNKQQLLSKTKLINECQNKLKEINDKLSDLDGSDSQLKVVGKCIEDYKSTLIKLKNSFNEAQKVKDIEELKESILKKERDLEKMDREYRILQQNYGKEQQLESEKNSVLEKQREISRIKSKHAVKLKKLFGENIPKKNLKSAILNIQNEEENSAKAITKKINKMEKDLTTLETTIMHNKKKLDNDKKELSMKQKKIAEVCDGKQFNQLLQETHIKKDKLQKDKGQYSSAKIMYEAFINKFEKDSPCCPICETDFTSRRSFVQEIIRKLKGKIERIPMDLNKVEINLKKEETFFNKLQQLKPINDDVDLLLNKRIPALEEELKSLNDELEEKQMVLASEKVNLTNPQDLIEASKDVITDAALLDQYQSDIDKSNVNIVNFEQTIVKVSSNRSRQETEAEMDILKADLSNIKNKLETMKKMLDQHKDRCHQLNMNIQNEIQKQIDIQKLVQEKPLLEIQKDELKTKLLTLNQETEELKDILVSMERDLKQASIDKQQVTQENRKVKEKERNRINLLKNTLNDIQKLYNSIEQYVKNDNDGKLDTALEELAKLNLNLEKMEQTKTKIVDAATEKKENLAKKESEFRALEDNVMLREKEKAEVKLNSDISELEKNIGGFNYRSVREEKQRIERNIDKFTKEISSFKGQKEEIAKQVKDLENELGKPQNKNAYNNFKKQFYELKVEKFLIDDLSEYIKVLEKSVLKFHEERMVQINRTVRELWRSIYRGNDIDYIEIKTDEHLTGGVNRRRTYNYKVVQVKNNVELEMRGRCSAGQKVLACLVIRMALAETFSSHCGILALDEPTTNLDRENIQSLSDALSRIIANRENQKNFQLLIITHDEDFLNNLTRTQSLDNYWRVKRNQSGFSVVQKCYL